ncbi:hypothetical protein HHK36_006819 [Tetracentron sinense]|uniref:Uncharacterized protein n=1 Tax=Tetracentron sinense TaxID=13715 RepID=A0A834ZHV5_TETSI|nr:hypothetical protein HHK36_006819 [Tetracentron sinense]
MNLKSCINATRSLEELSRQCYAETIILSSDEFVEIMLLDACFLVELFFVVSLEAEKPLAIQQVEVAPSHTMEVRIKGCQIGKRLLMVTTDLLSAVSRTLNL